MDHFENLVATVMETRGYWVRQSFKVNLTVEEKRLIGKHSMPRPEIDIVAYRPGEVIALEVKSFLDSPGVKLDDLIDEHTVPEGRYKLFTCTRYRDIVLQRLREDLNGRVEDGVSLRLGLAAGKVYADKQSEVRQLLEHRGMFFLSPKEIRDTLRELADGGYENDPAILAAKVLMR